MQLTGEPIAVRLELTYCVMISSHLAAIVGLWLKHGNIELFKLLLYISPLVICGAPVLWSFGEFCDLR